MYRREVPGWRERAWVLVLASACGPSPAAVVRPAGEEVVGEARPAGEPVESGVVGLLAARAVHHDDFARARLYTWTTVEQGAALRTSRRLLVADASSGPGPTAFNLALQEIVKARGPGLAVASLLLEHPGLRRRRYAWTSPMATTLGLAERRYGDVLVGVELDPEAWIASFWPGAAEPFAFVALDGRRVEVAEALAEPRRIAAIYHVREGARELIPYREFVLCNESMVARWSLATPELARLVAEELALVEALRTGPFAHVPELAARLPAAATWARAPEGPSLVERWHASLAFDGPRYRPTPGNLVAIAGALRAYAGDGEPLEHRPERVFPPGQGQQVGQVSR